MAITPLTPEYSELIHDLSVFNRVGCCETPFPGLLRFKLKLKY